MNGEPTEDRPRASVAMGLAAFGWLAFGVFFTGGMALSALRIPALTYLCSGLALATLVFPIAAGALGLRDLVLGRPGGIRAMGLSAVHLVIAGSLVVIVWIIVVTSRPHH